MVADNMKIPAHKVYNVGFDSRDLTLLIRVLLFYLSPAYYWPVTDLLLCIYEYINDQKQGIYIFIIAQL